MTNTQAEEAVIGCLLLDPAALYRFELTATEFALPHCRKAYEAICALVFEHGTAVDVLTVADEVRRRGYDRPTESDLADIAARVPTATNVAHYARIVRRLATQRRLIEELGRLQTMAREADPDHVVGLANELQRRLSQVGESQARVFPVGAGTAEAMVDIEADVPPLPRIATGLGKLDGLIGGIPVGNISLIAARPAQGKSTLARRMAYNMARQGRRVGYLSLEENRRQFSIGLMCSVGLVDSYRVMQGTLSPHEKDRLRRAKDMTADLPYHVCDERPLTPEQVEARLRQMKAEYGIEVGILDYWNRLILPGRHDRTDEASVVVSRMAGIAQELGIALVVCAQLNRMNESENRRPCLRDLKETGSWEESAFLVIFVHRPSVYKDTEPPDLAELIVAKQKLGPTGLLRQSWCGKYFWLDDEPPRGCYEQCNPLQCHHRPDLDYKPAHWSEEAA